MRRRNLVVRLGLAVMGVLTAAVVAAVPASAVAHGTLAAPGQDPFAVKLTMTNIPRPDGTFYNSACSAALISPTWIITAGHCFHDVNRNPVSGPTPYATTATLNTVDLSQSPGEVRTVMRVQQASNTDIALAQLSAPVTDVTPLGLSKAEPTKSELLTLAGWGATSDINPVPSTQLWLGVVKVSSVQPSTVYVVGYAPYADTSACLYDSGAPYVTRPPAGTPLLVSVESTGPNCPHTTPETTARVDPSSTGSRLSLPTSHSHSRRPAAGATVSPHHVHPIPAVSPCLWFCQASRSALECSVSVGGGAVAGVLAVRSVSRVVSAPPGFERAWHRTSSRRYGRRPRPCPVL